MNRALITLAASLASWYITLAIIFGVCALMTPAHSAEPCKWPVHHHHTGGRHNGH